MVATAPSTLARPPAQGRSASRIASDRQGATWASPETAVSEQLTRRHDRTAASCIGRARPHRGNSHPGRRRFSGHTRDGRYCRARYYHPGLQRFIGQDPIGFAGGDTNLYVYVANNPLLFVDPFGLDKTPRRQLKNCGGLPEVPLGQDIHGNVREMEQRSRFNIDNWLWFYYAVKSDGPWDYKQFGQGERQRVYKGAYNRYEAGGNFNYGATAAAFGIPDQVTLRMAGAYATWKGTSPPGVSWIFTPYGDDPLDQHWIEAGIAYYRCVARP